MNDEWWWQVMATKVYTSAEFKRERDNFLSLIKNMEKADTKKWLDEVKETLFRWNDTFYKWKSKTQLIEFQGSSGRREEGRVHQAGGRDREAPGLDPQGAGDTNEKRGESTFPENKLVEILKFYPWKNSTAKWCGLHGQKSHQGTFWGMWRLIWWYRLMYLINRSGQVAGS